MKEKGLEFIYKSLESLENFKVFFATNNLSALKCACRFSKFFTGSVKLDSLFAFSWLSGMSFKLLVVRMHLGLLRVLLGLKNGSLESVLWKTLYNSFFFSPGDVQSGFL